MRKFEYPVKRIHIIIRESEYIKLQNVADKRMTSVSNIIRKLLSDYLRQVEVEQLRQS